MVQLSVARPPKFSSTKKKIVAAIGAVVVSHVGILWALSHLPPMQLTPANPPKPVQVRFIESPKQEQPKPPAPVEPPKPKEIKIVETPPPPPKKVEKVQQVKQEVLKPKVVQPPKPTPVESPIASAVVSEVVVTPKPVVQPAVPKPVPVAEPTPAAPAVDMSPRDLGDAASVAWQRKPKPKIDQKDLKSVTESVVVLRIDVDDKGKIKAKVVQSSGSAKIDREMVRAVQAARFSPYLDKGVAVPFFAEQPFRLQ